MKMFGPSPGFQKQNPGRWVLAQARCEDTASRAYSQYQHNVERYYGARTSTDNDEVPLVVRDILQVRY